MTRRGQELARGVWCLWLHFSVKCSVLAIFFLLGREGWEEKNKLNWIFVLESRENPPSFRLSPFTADSMIFFDSLAKFFSGIHCNTPWQSSVCSQWLWEFLSLCKKQLKKSEITLWILGKPLFPDLWIFLVHKPFLFLSFSLLSLYFHWVSLAVFPSLKTQLCIYTFK